MNQSYSNPNPKLKINHSHPVIIWVMLINLNKNQPFLEDFLSIFLRNPTKGLQRMWGISLWRVTCQQKGTNVFPKHCMCHGILWRPSSTTVTSQSTGCLSKTDVKTRLKRIREAAKRLALTREELQEYLTHSGHLLHETIICCIPHMSGLWGGRPDGNHYSHTHAKAKCFMVWWNQIELLGHNFIRHRKKTAHQPNNSASSMNHAAEAPRYRTASAANHRHKTLNLHASVTNLKMKRNFSTQANTLFW